jgi:hypothetical protein
VRKDMENSKVRHDIKETVKYYVNRQRYNRHWVWLFVKAILESVVNFCSLRLWYSIFLFFMLYCIAFALYTAMKDVGGGVCNIIEKIIHVINIVRKILSIHGKISVKTIDALAALVDGTCQEFTSPSYTMRYWISRSLGNTLCEDMMWYESITLTRIFVSKPLSFMYVNVGVVPGEMCQLDMVWDMCAGVIGSMSLLDFMMQEGLWIIVGLMVMFPLVRYVLKVVLCLLHLAYGEAHFLLYRLQPKFKEGKSRFKRFMHRFHIFKHHISSHVFSSQDHQPQPVPSHG